MANAIGQSLPMAIGAALSPFPIIAVVLMLATPRARVNGPLFIVGWLAGFAIIGVIVLAIVGPSAATSGEPATGVSWLKLAIAGATAIAQTGISGSEQAISYVVFTLIATIGVAAPLVIFFVMGDRSRDVLEKLKVWMAHNNAVIMAVICLLIGVKLIGDAIGGF